MVKMAGVTEDDKRTPDEKKLFELIEKGSNEAVISHVKATQVKVDCLDPKGMTPLQLAAFRGNKELCEFFLANGADVNSNYHENSYSALMFAALSGNRDVTRLMLEAGANVNHTNSVNRTASQMAAFVGQHQCVSVINNYFPREEIDYYTKPQGLEKEPKLPPNVAPALCTLVNFTNLHPVKISLYLQNHPELLDESAKVCIVLSRIVEKNMKSREINDIVAMKCHFISTVIKLAAEARGKDKDKSLNGWLKRLKEDWFKERKIEIYQVHLVRQAIKDFPYATSALLQQLVRQIAPVKIGNTPTALSILISSLNGQQFAWDASEGCDTCGEAKAEAKCAKCKMVVYCNRDCQKLHWATHKKFCERLADMMRSSYMFTAASIPTHVLEVYSKQHILAQLEIRSFAAIPNYSIQIVLLYKLQYKQEEEQRKLEEEAVKLRLEEEKLRLEEEQSKRDAESKTNSTGQTGGESNSASDIKDQDVNTEKSGEDLVKSVDGVTPSDGSSVKQLEQEITGSGEGVNES
uniref:MYND-type domain-containing protein n=1 Tax=Biomphalaria glabrata TaxID=6526 RepID=A0A2C9MAI1_BIOGL